MEQRYKAVMEVLEAHVPVTEVAERYGVSRQSVHAWVRRYRADGIGGLIDRSHRPEKIPAQIEPRDRGGHLRAAPCTILAMGR